MSQVLYRKYRSQTFDELVGQEHVTSILKNAVISGSIAHAYLFSGSRGTGKTSTARILAKALNCLDLGKDGNPCGKCGNCEAIRNGNFLDLIEIDAASNRGIDQIRELKEKLEFLPVEGKYKIYIIDEVHMLTNEAFNALLKTLEEPPAHVIFMLATTDVHKLPPTILSRCQRYDMKLGSDAEIAEVVSRTAESEGIKLDKDALDIMVESANGSYRDSLSLLDVIISAQSASKDPKQVSADEVRRVLGVPDAVLVNDLLSKLVSRDGKAALTCVRELESKGVNLQHFTKYVLKALQEVLVSQIEGSKVNGAYKFAEKVDKRGVLQLINLFIKAEKEMKNLSVPGIMYDMIIAEFVMGESGSVANNSTPKPVRQNSSSVKAADKSIGQIKSITVESDANPLSAPAPSVDLKFESNVKAPIQADATDVIVKLEKEFSISKAASSVTETVKEAASNAQDKVDITLEQLKESWGDVTDRVKSSSTHLAAFVKTAKLLSLDRSIIRIEVPFPFHKDRLEEPRNRDLLSNVFQELFNTNLGVECQVNANPNKKRAVSADVILQNMPKPAEPPKTENAAESKKADSSAKPEKKEYKVSKKVEAIFEGM